MAVFKILPEKNLKAEDIRDTLLAYGADWSNEKVKNANYLPNYFKKSSKINIYSKRKPTECGDDLHYVSSEGFKKVQYGIVLSKYKYANREKFYNDYINGLCDIDIEEPKVKRLSDFCGYYPEAINPAFVDIRNEIVTSGETQFEVDTSGGTDHNVGFYEIYPPEYRHLGVRISFDNHVFWSTSPIDWDSPLIPKPDRETVGEIFEFMCNGEFLSTGNVELDHISMMPIFPDSDNPHPVRFIPKFDDPMDIYLTVMWEGERPSHIKPDEYYDLAYEVEYVNNKTISEPLGRSFIFWKMDDAVKGNKVIFLEDQVVLSPSGKNGDRANFEGTIRVKGDPSMYTYEVRCNGISVEVEFDDDEDTDE